MSTVDVQVIVAKAEVHVGLTPDSNVDVFVTNPEISVDASGPPGPRGPRGEKGDPGDKGEPGDIGPPGQGTDENDFTDEIWRAGEGTVQLREYDPSFQTERGVLPFVEGTVRFSTNVDGTGVLEFEILSTDLDWYDGWLAGIILEIEQSPGVWKKVATYSTRDDFLQRAASDYVRVRAHETLSVWAKETLIVPEEMLDWTWRSMPDNRQMGWMASAYDPTQDKFGEPWNKCVQLGDTHELVDARPQGWPKGTAARWITASGNWEDFQRKYFRGWLNVPDDGFGTRRKVRFYLSAEETTTLYVAGVLVFKEEFSEGEWRNKYRARSMYLEPGTYAVGMVNDSVPSGKGYNGFKGSDPTILAVGLYGDDGKISHWLLESNKDSFRACRRTDNPETEPGRPPGPTPGEALSYIFTEAQERLASGWPYVTAGFTGTLDSYGVAWSDVVTEREWRVGDDYLDILQGLAETDDADCWIDPETLTLEAAPARGTASGKTWAEAQVYALKVVRLGKRGTWAMGQRADGDWYSRAVAGFRREFLLTMGQAVSRWTAHRMLNAALRDSTRWDAEVHLDIPAVGWKPFIDFNVGDTGNINYRGHVRGIRVQGIAAYPGEGGLAWRLDVTEDLGPLTLRATVTREVG